MAYLYRVVFDEDHDQYAPPVCVRAKITSDTPARVRIKGRPYRGWGCRSDVPRSDIGEHSFYTEAEAWFAWERETIATVRRYRQYINWHTQALTATRRPAEDA